MMPLISLADGLAHARQHRYALGAFNVLDTHFLRALFAAAKQERSPFIINIADVDSIGQRNSYVKTWGCGGFLNETNIYSRGKSLCF